MIIYADTSFLASVYCLDAYSMKASQLIQRFNPSLMLTPLAELELTNALELRAFRRENTAAEIRASKTQIQNHIVEGFLTVAAMPSTVYELARRIALKQSAITGTRTLDILHVASAVLLRADEFWTFDKRQAGLAKGEGLQLR